MWADNETTLDLVGFQVHADLIRSVVTDRDLLPITIGVFGDWGSGKTSIMKMLQRDLNPEQYPEESPERQNLEGVVCLYFNGWLFEGYDDAKSALLSSILLQLGEHQRFGSKLRQQAASLLASVDWMRLVRLGFREVAIPATLAYLTGGVSLLPSIANAAKVLLGVQTGQNSGGGTVTVGEPKIDLEDVFKKDSKPSGPMDVRTFRERFSKMLADSDIRSLVVLVDDLDRCSPQRIIDNLEAIKLFLSVEKTAFIIGADPRIVRHAIATTYKPDEIQAQTEDLEAQTDIVTDYLEKLIQLPYRLPRLSPAEVQTYMSLLFCFRDLDSASFGQVHAALERQRAGDRYSVFGYGAINAALGGNLCDELVSSLSFCTSVGPLIAKGLKGNPRQVKRFLNAFVLRKRLAEVARLENIRDDVLVKLMVLEYTHLKQFNELFQWQSADEGFPVKLQQLEQALCPPNGDVDDQEATEKISPGWAKQFVRRWVAMEPYLADVDLRDYFWVARDRLQSALADVAMVPPLVRRIVDDLLSENEGRQASVVKVLGDIDAEERAQVIALLSRQIERHPGEPNGYDAIRRLIEAGVPGSAETLADVLRAVPPEKIPPALGMDLLTLLKARGELNAIFAPVIKDLQDTQTRFGMALRQGQKG